jgi:hypothetical protein
MDIQGLATTAEAWQAKHAGGLTEFTVFPKLPRELRDQIWKPATPGKLSAAR